jgi:hypothetical protein
VISAFNLSAISAFKSQQMESRERQDLPDDFAGFVTVVGDVKRLSKRRAFTQVLSAHRRERSPSKPRSPGRVER